MSACLICVNLYTCSRNAVRLAENAGKVDGMRHGRSKTLKLKLAVLSFLSLSAFTTAAHAGSHRAHAGAAHHSTVHSGSHARIQHTSVSSRGARRGFHFASSRHHAHVIQCVAYAKTASDVMLRGNARDWWHNAAGVYDRGQAPESGSVLNFRATRRMPLGHVAVVHNVIDSRTITIDQSHWAQAGVSRNVAVIDVSPNNDWSAVRVALNGGSGNYGSIYPTYGFIYPRHDGTGQSLRQTVMTAWNKKNTATQLAQAPEAPVKATPAAATQDATATAQNDGPVAFGNEE